ncbi:RNA polymerase binding protein [Erwinia phage FBB1]|nr:RNA polymerase binding protein [Erwinia phage FBB1]
MITVKDIQVVNVRADSNPNNDNKIRKAWVLQTPELVQEKIKAKYKSQEVRFAFYDAVDSAVSDKWVEIMRRHYNDSLAAGAKLVLDKAGAERLENDFCVDADEQLIEAASIVVAEVIEDLAA